MKKSLKILLALVVLGILFMLFISFNLNPSQTTRISNITEKNLNQLVKIEGQIISIKEYSNNTFQVLKIQDKTGVIEATASSNNDLKSKINFSLNYSILGRVSEYNKTIQVTINELKTSS